MPEFNIGFSTHLTQAARFVADQGLDSEDAMRTVLYLSKLACEIVLKALLEKAGRPIAQISCHRHDLAALLIALGKCEVQEEITRGSLSWVPAIRLRGKVVDTQYANATVGHIFRAEELGASKYPNEIRYGDNLRDFPPDLWLKTANTVINWAHDHWERIRV